MTLVVNPKAKVVWEYSNYQFNSFCTVGGVVYGANDNGIYVLDSGDLDDTAAVVSTVVFGNSPLAETNSRVTAAYVSAKAAGDLLITLSADSVTASEYTVTPIKDSLSHRYRVVTAKGMVGKYWTMTASNPAGSDFTIDSIDLDVAASARRL